MKAVIQRVSRASVTVDGRVVSRIERGIVTLLGVVKGDTEEHARKIVKKIVELRIFEDDAGKMNLSLLDVQGSHLIISQFTLGADLSAGKRPSFVNAERPQIAKPLYERALALSTELGAPTAAGIFQADMKVELVNDGPVTIVLDMP